MNLGKDVSRALACLRDGNLLGLPTETVYGLAADARQPAALAKVFAAKRRPIDHPLIVHIGSHDLLEQWAAEVPQSAHDLAERFWPGPLTMILPRQPHVSDLLTGGQSTVGLRLPAHPLSLVVLQEFNDGIAAPSANRFGRISPTSAKDVLTELGSAVSYVLDGGICPVGIESTIIDLTSDQARILRPGMLDWASLKKVIPNVLPFSADYHGPRVAGTLAAHYAPTATLRIITKKQWPLALADIKQHLPDIKVAVLRYGEQAELQQKSVAVDFLLNADAAGYARQLYAALRAADAAGVELILVQQPPEGDAWEGVNDRLRRAAYGSGENI